MSSMCWETYKFFGTKEDLQILRKKLKDIDYDDLAEKTGGRYTKDELYEIDFCGDPRTENISNIKKGFMGAVYTFAIQIENYAAYSCSFIKLLDLLIQYYCPRVSYKVYYEDEGDYIHTDDLCGYFFPAEYTFTPGDGDSIKEIVELQKKFEKIISKYKKPKEDYSIDYATYVTKDELKKICNEMFPDEEFSVQYARLNKYSGQLFYFRDSPVYRELREFLPKSEYDDESAEDSENADEKEGKEYSLDEFVQLAVDGDVGAMAAMGRLLEFGEEYEDAIKFYKDAAKQNNEEALVNLARMYFEGTGVKKNLATALKYYKQAAELGNTEGQVGTAAILYIKLMKNKDKLETVVDVKNEFLKNAFLAAVKEDSTAMSLLGKYFDEIAGDSKTAKIWKNMAVKYGSEDEDNEEPDEDFSDFESEYEEHAPEIEYEDGLLLSEDGKTLISFDDDDEELNDTIKVPNSVEKIEMYALKYCHAKQIILPKKLKTIDLCAFYCSDITKITIPEGIETLSSGCFKNCEALKSIRLPLSLKEIGTEAFSHWNESSLKQIIYKGTKADWKKIKLGEKCFENVPAKVIKCTDGEIEIKK